MLRNTLRVAERKKIPLPSSSKERGIRMSCSANKCFVCRSWCSALLHPSIFFSLRVLLFFLLLHFCLAEDVGTHSTQDIDVAALRCAFQFHNDSAEDALSR